MKTLIPSIEDAGDSDDSGDEIPPGGVFGHGGGEAEEEEEGDGEEASDGDGGSINGDVSPDRYNGNQALDGDAYGEDYESNSDSDSDDDLDSSSSSSEEEMVKLSELFGVTENSEANREHPPQLETEAMIMDLCFHPEADLLSMASIDGKVFIRRYNKEVTEEVTHFSHHKMSCRSVCYNEDGSLLFTTSEDKSLAVLDMGASAIKQHLLEAHESPISSFFCVDENMCATGDDKGTVKVWDLRKRKAAFKVECGEEAVKSLLGDEGKKTLVAALGDGSINTFDLRKKALDVQSEMYPSELTSLGLVRDGSRLVVGSGEGTLYIFKWGEFSYHIDQFPGHRGMINCITPITDNLFITGCEDTNIRAVQLYPHRFVGIVGQHDYFGVDNISVSHDGTLLASCALEEVVRFWNIEYLYDMDNEESKKGSKKRKRNYNLPSSKRRNRCDFFSDIPEVVNSDDEGGPVAGPSHTSD
ncbi:WD repeat-containing protein 55-like [Eriocheir sinensis]|uniref:WD repeat-containing protein 55-like n=1 Tax=Eriocheir sinensis TaxID=95602 RepID=UPI0021C663EE|nr:WD repeat-containing protein 55-like [Eriocheir sinensis]